MKSAFLIALAVVGFSINPALAQKKDVAKGGDPDAKAQAVADLGPAFQLIEIGRQYKSPEVLVTAAGMLRRFENLTSGKLEALEVKITDDKDKEVKASTEKPVSLGKEADDLFEEAEALTLTKKGDIKAIKALIERTKAEADKDVRGAVGGPRFISNLLGSPAFHQFTIAFEAGQKATVNFRSTGNCQFEIYAQGGNRIYHQTGTSGSYSWSTVGKGGIRAVTVKVINGKGQPVPYTIRTN